MMSDVKNPHSQRYGSSLQDSLSDGDNALYKVDELLLTANKDLHWKVSYLEAELRTLKLADHHSCDPCCLQKLSFPSAETRKSTDFYKDPRKVSEDHQRSQRFPDKLFSWCQPDKSRNDYEKRSYPKRLKTYAQVAKENATVSAPKKIFEKPELKYNQKTKLQAENYKKCKFCNI